MNIDASQSLFRMRDHGLMMLALACVVYAVSGIALAQSGSNYCKGVVKGTDGKVRYVGEDVTLGIGKKGSLEVIERVPDTALKVGECKMIEKDKNGKVVKEWKTSPAGQQKPSTPKPGSPTAPSTPKVPTSPGKTTPSPAQVPTPPAKEVKQKKDEFTKSLLYNTPILASFLSSMFSERNESPTVVREPETVIRIIPVVPSGDVAEVNLKQRAPIIMDTTFTVGDVAEMRVPPPTDATDELPAADVSSRMPAEKAFLAPTSASTFAPNAYEEPEMHAPAATRVLGGETISLAPGTGEQTTEVSGTVAPTLEAEMLSSVRENLATVEHEVSRLRQEYVDGACGVECALSLAAEEQRARVLRAAGESLESESADIVIAPIEVTDEIIGTETQIKLKSADHSGPVRLATRGAYYMMLYDEEGNAYRCNVHGYCTPTGEFVPVVRKKKSLPITVGSMIAIEDREVRATVTALFDTLLVPVVQYRQDPKAPCTLLSSLSGGCAVWLR